MIEFDFKNDCSGCGGCADVCPSKCISMQEDRDGFMMPVFEKDACVQCGRCERICPVLNHKTKSYNGRKCYLVYHKDPWVRRSGSSGSVFFALAKSIIDDGGVVYGAAMCGLKVLHTRATDMEGVRRQMSSKYIQSYTGDIYKQVLADLRLGKRVLFVGTPCQCKALHNISPSSLRDNLLIADIICHGVPSQDLFDKSIFLYEKKKGVKIKSFSFREKTNDSLRNYKIVYTKDGNTYENVGDLDDLPFCFGFFNHITWRSSCYKCKQKSIQRDSDITIGDFWGIDGLKPEIKDFQKGYSCLIVNSDRGGQVVFKLDSCVIDEIPNGVDFVIDHNHAYSKLDKKGLMRKLFFFCLRNFGYSFCEKHFLQQKPLFLDRMIRSLVIRIDGLTCK